MSSSSDDFVQAAQDLTASLRAATSDPADQVRLLTQLAVFAPVTLSPTAEATAAVCRRAALAELAKAVSDYQPTSSTEAEAVLAQIMPLYTAEVVYAADNGDFDSYYALRALRSSVSSDLQERSVNLPELIEVTWPSNKPALVIAYALYADSTRETDLLQRNPQVPNPNFMPTYFEALSR